MKKWIIRIVIGLATIFALAVLLLFIFFRSQRVACPEFKNTYFEMLPYSEGDRIVFSNGTNQQNFVVTKVEIHHTDWFNSTAKCGCCEDEVRNVLKSETETIDITFANYKNPESCFGGDISIAMKNAFYHSPVYEPEKMIEVENKVIITKGKGLTRFTNKDGEWKLLEFKGSDGLTKIESGGGC